MHARRVRPSTGPTDRRRLAAAASSAVLPGLGQLVNGRRRLAKWLLVPSLAVIAVAWILVATQSVTSLAAKAIVPATLSALLLLNALVLGWRLFAVGQAYFDGRYRGAGTGRWAVGGLVAIAALVTLPHLVAWQYGQLAERTFAGIFAAEQAAREDRNPLTVPKAQERINVLLIGTDARKAGRKDALTDTLIVVSVDPVGKTASMVSIPRDMVDVPLGNGDVFGPKINTLRRYADDHRDEFPGGGLRTLQDALGTLLGIRIHYYAELDLRGFVKLVDAVGGVDINVKKPLDDPSYPRPEGGRGFSIEEGKQRLDGLAALAYARIRKPAGESDFTRAGRQQQVLLAIRKAIGTDDLLFRLPNLLDSLDEIVDTDIPIDRLPELATLAEEIAPGAITRVVIKKPLVKAGPRAHRYGSVQIPNLGAIAAMAAKLFPPPGVEPQGWPTPKPSPSPEPGDAPSRQPPPPH